MSEEKHTERLTIFLGGGRGLGEFRKSGKLKNEFYKVAKKLDLKLNVLTTKKVMIIM